MGESSRIRLVLIFLVCLAICFALSGVWHELIGHGLTAILLGGSIDSIHLFGFNVFPNFQWSGIAGGIGVGALQGKLLDIVIIMGPISTWLVSVLAVIALWIRRPVGLLRVILVCLSLWCYDILCETWMAVGVPQYLFFSTRPPLHHYEAAVRLGIPISLVYVFSITTSGCLLVGLAVRLIWDHKQRKQQYCK